MSSIAVEKSCCIALNVIGNIAHSTCYHSFLFLFYVLFKIFCKKYCLLQNKLYICTRVKEVIYTANFKT